MNKEQLIQRAKDLEHQISLTNQRVQNANHQVQEATHNGLIHLGALREVNQLLSQLNAQETLEKTKKEREVAAARAKRSRSRKKPTIVAKTEPPKADVSEAA